MNEIFDLIIVGMGPAGLAAAARLKSSGINFAIIDAGKAVNVRDRFAPEDATSGHGGAGLFSDGKFSFFPSATELWTLPKEEELRAAYNWTCDVLNASGLDTPPFPEDPNAYSVGSDKAEWVLKAYPSDYLSLPARLQLVGEMVDDIEGKIFNECHVNDIKYDRSADNFELAVSIRGLPEETLLGRRIIMTTGRFGPLSSTLMGLTEQRNFRRLEVGFRIEQSEEQAFFRDIKLLDPKLRFRQSDDAVEWRTFCVCRQGEAVLTETEGLWTVSGRSDCPPTGRSNSGFNTRIQDKSLALQALKPVIKAMARPDSHFVVPMTGLLDDDVKVVKVFNQVYGTELRHVMKEGLSRLAEAFPKLGNDKSARLIGPTLEGVGWYPTVDGNLKLLDCPAYVAGDACGLFRGIVAAMISGHYAAALALDEFLH